MEKYSLQKKSETQHDSVPLPEESVNEVMQDVVAGENDTSTQDLAHSPTGGDDLMKLFNQFTG